MTAWPSPVWAASSAIEADGAGRFTGVVRALARAARRRRDRHARRPARVGAGRVRGLCLRPRGRRVARVARLRAGLDDRARGVAGPPVGRHVADRQRAGRPRRHARRCDRAGGGAAAVAARRARCRCSTPIPPAATRWPARCRPPTTRRRSPARSSGSAAGSSRRSSWPARWTSTRPRRTIRARCSACCARRLTARYVYAVGRGDATFIGASPELLIRREGQRATTVALAGSARRSADPAVDDHLGEQLMRSDKDREENAIVAPADRPHAAPVLGVGDRGARAGGGAGGQHPAPGGADPRPARRADGRDRARRPSAPDARRRRRARRARCSVIPALEGFDRGWYAGAVGWTDASGDGEFCVALRCALLRGRVARCYAGGGDRARLGAGGRAGRDRGQAAGDAAGAVGLSARTAASAGSASDGAARGSRRGRCGPR